MADGFLDTEHSTSDLDRAYLAASEAIWRLETGRASTAEEAVLDAAEHWTTDDLESSATPDYDALCGTLFVLAC